MYALLAQWFDRHRLERLETGIHPSAVIAPTAHIAAGASIGTNCGLEEGDRTGPGTRPGPAGVIGAHSAVGTECLLLARAPVYPTVKTERQACRAKVFWDC